MEGNEEYYYSEDIMDNIDNQNQDTDLINEYMLSTITTIKEDFLMKYPQETSNFYVYTKYNEQIHLFKIFVTLLKETKINKREININFLIILDKEFPAKPPMVFCTTDVKNFFIIHI